MGAFDLNLYEPFTRADGKTAYRLKDQSIGYRSDELTAEVAALLDRCRSRHLYPTREFIDRVISYQEESPLKAARYIRYIKLGEIANKDVFGPDAEKQYQAARYQKELDKLREQLQDLQDLKTEVKDIKEILANIQKSVDTFLDRCDIL